MSDSPFLQASENPSAHTQANTDPTLYDTPDGHALVRELLKALPYDPHDYIISGICPVLDGRDLLATLVTGGGKTGFFVMLMIVMSAIAKDPSCVGSRKTFPKDPAMVIICPTKALQETMASVR